MDSAGGSTDSPVFSPFSTQCSRLSWLVSGSISHVLTVSYTLTDCRTFATTHGTHPLLHGEPSVHYNGKQPRTMFCSIGSVQKALNLMALLKSEKFYIKNMHILILLYIRKSSNPETKCQRPESLLDGSYPLQLKALNLWSTAPPGKGLSPHARGTLDSRMNQANVDHACQSCVLVQCHSSKSLESRDFL